MAEVRLDCPLCGVVVSDASQPPAPGRCPGCGARFAGGGERPRDAAEAALVMCRMVGDPDALAHALFAEDLAGHGLAITSDRRDGFYGWWVFVADGADGELAGRSGARGGTG